MALAKADPVQFRPLGGDLVLHRGEVGLVLGDTAAQRQLQTAVEVAKAPFSGGGGFVQNAKGATGTGSASSSGAGNT